VTGRRRPSACGSANWRESTTLRGKLRVWRRELDRIGLNGDEQLLDLGCGRGAVLIAAATRLPTGRAVGVALWSKDQSGNNRAATLANAAAAGVTDCVEVHTADMAALPFADGSFDSHSWRYGGPWLGTTLPHAVNERSWVSERDASRSPSGGRATGVERPLSGPAGRAFAASYSTAMLPSGHIAAGILLGAHCSRRSEWRPAVVVAGAVVGTCLPDIDLLIPSVLDDLAVEHDLCSGRHHSWITHTPLFWGSIVIGVRRLARRSWAPAWAPEAAQLLAVGVAVHLLQDSLANTVALLWPLRRREYGLGLDHLAGETDHVAYMRRYPSSPAGKLEGLLVLAAVAVGGRGLFSDARRRRSTP
jgi:SAM-dependent methyltransferase